jgi:hypothetical protein
MKICCKTIYLTFATSVIDRYDEIINNDWLIYILETSQVAPSNELCSMNMLLRRWLWRDIVWVWRDNGSVFCCRYQMFRYRTSDWRHSGGRTWRLNISNTAARESITLRMFHAPSVLQCKNDIYALTCHVLVFQVTAFQRVWISSICLSCMPNHHNLLDGVILKVIGDICLLRNLYFKDLYLECCDHALENSSKYVWFSILRVLVLCTAVFKNPWLTLLQLFSIHVLTTSSISLQKTVVEQLWWWL